MKVQQPLVQYCCFFLALLLQSFYLNAGSLKINGFVAQGVIQAKDSNFVNDDGDVSLKLTEMGVNGSYRIDSKLRVAGQVVYLEGGNRYPDGFQLDYLFLEWQIFNGQNWQVKTQIGRNKNYHWLYSATRDVPTLALLLYCLNLCILTHFVMSR